MSHCVTLSPQMLAIAFPFHFVIDRKLRVIQAGDVLQRLCFKALVNGKIEHHFRIYRPANISFDFDVLVKRLKSLFIVESLHSEMQLKGQMMYSEEQDLIFFLGSPWVTDTKSLSPLGVKLKDFAVHDPVVDFVFLLQASQNSLNETKELTQKLTQQKAQLSNALLIKDNLAKIAEAQARRLEETIKDLQKTQAQLVQTEKMSSLGQMVAGVAHEINNPINFIHGNLNHVKEYTHDLLKLINLYQEKSQETDQEIQDFVNEIDLDFLIEDLPQIISSMQVGTQRICEIVTSLRTFSRLDEAEHKVVDIHSGIDSTLMLLKHRLKANSSRLAIKVIKDYGDLPKVECYAGQLNQVFMNLLSNAIDALEEWDSQRSPEEKRQNPSTIHITTISNPNRTVTIKIADNGPAIPETHQKQLFDPFFTTKSVGKGTGLGLSISYQIIVDKHSGKLWCQSEPEQGVTFYIELPQLLPQNSRCAELKQLMVLPQ
ncbi:ATP-binding protein [Sphaerothrix gracilis]|uniref:ATP-binding protein n=1 Tax=Sphaerothrix gracilis TaxID=3151835 RepID=UPI0031FCBC41